MKSLGQRIIAVLIVVLILGQMLTVGISRYNSLRENVQATGEDVELTIWYTDAKLNDFMLDAAEDYKEETGITVNVQLISAVDYIETISEATLVEENGPDLFVAGSDLLQKALYAGLVDNQVTYSEAESDNIPQKAFDAATCDGKLIGYPFYFESCFLLYNQYYAEDWPRNIDQILEYADNFENTGVTEKVQNIFKWDVSDIFYNYFFIGNYVGLGGTYGDEKSQLSLSEGKVIDCLEYYQSLNEFFAIDEECKILVQEFCEIEEGDIRVHVLTLNGKQEIVSVTMRAKGGKDFRTNLSLGNSQINDIKLTPEQKKIALDTAKASGLIWCGVDLLPLKNGKTYVIEYNGAPGPPSELTTDQETLEKTNEEFYTNLIDTINKLC